MTPASLPDTRGSGPEAHGTPPVTTTGGVHARREDQPSFCFDSSVVSSILMPCCCEPDMICDRAVLAAMIEAKLPDVRSPFMFFMLSTAVPSGCAIVLHSVGLALAFFTALSSSLTSSSAVAPPLAMALTRPSAPFLNVPAW